MIRRSATALSSSTSSSSTTASRQFFAWLESRFGGNVPMDTGAAAEILTHPTLRAQELQRLLRHDAVALRVPGFYDPAAAASWGTALAEEYMAGKGQNWKVSTQRGLESSDVSTLGEHPPFNVVANSTDPQDRHAYFEGVKRELNVRRRRSSTNNYHNNNGSSPQPLYPLDLLRLQLDEAWPYGANLAREEDGERRRPFSGGLPRIMRGPTRWKQGYVHVDEMGPLNPQQGLFSANIYLQLPPAPTDDGTTTATTATTIDNKHHASATQNVMEIWPTGIRSRWDWYRNAVLLSGLSSQDAEAQVRLRHALGEPIRIPANPGDLIVMCVQRPHAAIGFSNGVRVSLQCFLQYAGPKKGLLIDS